MSSSELLRKSPGNLLRNFLRHILEMKSDKEVQQQVYNAVLRRPIEDKYNDLTLTLFNNNEIKINPSPFLDSITASGVPLNSVKEIQVRLDKISGKDWEAFNIQTLTGTLLQVQVSGSADYSPRIYEMLQSSRLTQFR